MLAYTEFGRLLSTIREQRGLSRECVAKSSNMSVQYYIRLEQGKASITLVRLAAIHNTLRLDINALLHALPVEVIRAAKRSHPQQFVHRRSFGKYGVLGRRERKTSAVAGAIRQTAPCARLRCDHVNRRLERTTNIENRVFRGFGALIRMARESLGMTIAEVANAAHCAQDEYAAIERGDALPTMATLVYLHSALRFDVATGLRTIWESPAFSQLDR